MDVEQKVVSCIFTLDSIDPIFYEFNIQKENILFNEYIKNFFIKEYSEINEMIYDFYKYCKIEKPTGTITYIYNELNKNDKMPNYILNYFILNLK